MKLKLEKAYRHTYATGSGDYFDSYDVLVKVIKDNPAWNPWERACCFTLHIHYYSRANEGHNWVLSSFSDEMDKIMQEEIGDSYKSYATRAAMMKDLEKIVARNKPLYYDKLKPIEYELA